MKIVQIVKIVSIMVVVILALVGIILPLIFAPGIGWEQMRCVVPIIALVAIIAVAFSHDLGLKPAADSDEEDDDDDGEIP